MWKAGNGDFSHRKRYIKGSALPSVSVRTFWSHFSPDYSLSVAFGQLSSPCSLFLLFCMNEVKILSSSISSHGIANDQALRPRFQHAAGNLSRWEAPIPLPASPETEHWSQDYNLSGLLFTATGFICNLSQLGN